MTAKLRGAASLVALLGCLASGALADGPLAGEKQPPAAADAKNPAPNLILVTISKETTLVTQPLRKDGYVDYVAALNEIYNKGVTPENNAAVLLWRALGPARIAEKDRAEYFRMLGTPIPADKANCFIEMDAFVRQHNPVKGADNTPRFAAALGKIVDQTELASARAWSEKEFPVVAAWLTANERPLDLVVESSRRPRYFEPLVVDSESLLLSATLPLAQAQREIATALVDRAMLRLASGKTEAAWQDLLAVHRLARLCGQGPMLVHALLSEQIDARACEADYALLQYARPTAAVALQMRDQLDKLPPPSAMCEKIDRSERFVFLDLVAFSARNGMASAGHKLWGTNAEKTTTESLINLGTRAGMDWDVILRIGNSWYDRTVEALRKPAVADQRKALAGINRDIDSIVHPAKKWAPTSLVTLRHDVSEHFGRVFVALLLPSTMIVADPEYSAEMRFGLTKLAFSLAAYRADDGSYPATLDELVPKYAAAIPKDIFIAGNLHYNRRGDSYVLYSVGANGKDDGGKGTDDRKGHEDWDDIVVRMRKAS